MSLAVEISYYPKKLKNVKMLDPCLRKKHLTPREIWERILKNKSGIPACPKCEKELIVVSICAQYKMTDINRPLSSEVELVLECPVCLKRFRCVGSNLKIKDDGYEIDSLVLEEEVKNFE